MWKNKAVRICTLQLWPFVTVLNTPRHKYCKGCRNTTVQNIAVIKEAAAPSAVRNTNLPKRWNWKRKADISHISSRPALCSWFRWNRRDHRRYQFSYQDFCNFSSQLDINHTDTVEKNGRCIQTSAQSPPLRRAPFDTAHLRARASRWGTPPVRQDTTRDKLGWRSLILLSFIWNRESKKYNIEEFIPRIKPNFVVGTPDVKQCDSKFIGI